MSRFFVGGSDSESESENESGSGSEEETFTKAPSRFAKSNDSSDDDDTPKRRVIKSARDKQFDELKDTIKSIRNAININDWNKIQDEFDNLNRQLTKASQLVQKEGIPKFYVKALIDLEEAIKDTDEKKPKMNATNTKSFKSMKQKVKKNNTVYQKEIDEQRKNPNAEESEEEKEAEKSGDDSESEEEEKVTPKAAPKAAAKPAKAAKDDDESGSDSDWGDDDDDDESSSEDENDGRVNKWFLPPQKVKEMAEKKKAEAEKKEQEKDKNQKEQERKERAKKAAEAKEAGAIAKADEKKPIEMSTEEVKTKLKEVLSNRGKRNTDPTKQTEKLNDLLSYAKNPELQVEILTHLVSAQFDSGRGISSYMPVPQWKSCYNNLIQILSILEQNPDVELHEAEELAEQSADADDEVAVRAVTVNLVAFIERLDDELTKSFQAIDPHTQEYVQRLQDENSLLDLMEKTQDYYMRKGKSQHAAHVSARRIEHIYYKLDAHTSEDKTAAPEPGTPASADAAIKAAATATRSNKDLIEKLSSLVLAHGDERLKTRAMLCHIYYYALHDRFYEARDMMLMSHLQDSIIHMDISTQILFNRTQVQIGLCAFRNNLIKNAYNCLAEVHAGGRVKELLAQGITTRHNEKSAEQEKQERKRQLPYHMHINLELLEAVHLICAMLLEVPTTAAHAFDVKKKVTSRFDKLLEFYDRQVFTGPPEDTRNMILAASKNLSKGDWKKCEEQLLGLSVWNLVHNSDQVKSMLRRKIQEEGLRTYVFTFSPHYKSMSLQTLSDMFELPKNNVHSIISKMMINEELHASWDQPTGAIVMHGVEPSRLQYLAMQLADKAAGFVEVNERNSDPRSAMGVGYGYNKYDNKGQKGDQRKGDNRNRNEGRDNRGGQDRRKGGERGDRGDRNDRQDRDRAERRDHGERRERDQRDNKQRNMSRNK